MSFFLFSHVLRPTRHLPGIPLQPFLPFEPLLFGLSPAALPFHHTYMDDFRANDAMVHVLLAFVR
jgi:hypothetical protein